MRDFEKNINNEVLIIEVDLFRASIKDAAKFRVILDKELEKGFRNIIVDLSKCTFIDSSFIGALVVTLKKLVKLGGDLELVITSKIIQNAVHLSRTVELFTTYYTLEEALNSRGSSEVEIEVKIEKLYLA